MNAVSPRPLPADVRLDSDARARLVTRRLDPLVLAALTAATGAAVLYAGYGLQVHHALHTTAYDLAFFDQILWNTAHGHLFATSYVSYNFLGQHFEPLLLLMLPLYRLGAGPETLIIIQALAACAAAVPLALVGRRLVGPLPALTLSGAYLVSPALQRGLDFGFHPDLFEPLLLFSALLLLLQGRRHSAVVAIALLLCTKEDTFLLVAFLGWICVLQGNRRFGVALTGVALLWGVVVIGLLMPLMRAGQQGDLLQRYSYLGASAPQIVAGALLHSRRLWAHLAAPGPAGAVLLLLVTTGLLPLLAPELLFGAIPVVLVSLLSASPQQAGLALHYGVPSLAVCCIAAVYGLRRLKSWFACRRVRLHTLGHGGALLVLAGASASGFVLGPFPGEGGFAPWRFHDYGEAKQLQRVMRLIPVDARVSAQTGLAAHLAHRAHEWEFPRLDDARYVVLEEGGIVSAQGQAAYEATVASLPARGFVEVAQAGRIRLWEREAP